jgi:hypothetical protein
MHVTSPTGGHPQIVLSYVRLFYLIQSNLTSLSHHDSAQVDSSSSFRRSWT